MLHVTQIIATLASEAAGPSYSVRRLAESVIGEGTTGSLFTTMRRGSEAGTVDPLVTRFPLDRFGGAIALVLASSGELQRAIFDSAGDGAVLHSHGLWLLPNLYPAWAAAKTGAPHIVSPRGMLAKEALAFSSTKKRLMWMMAQRRALQGAACLHATSDAEAQEFRAMGLGNAIAIVPNGIDLPDLVAFPRRSLKASRTGLRTVLHLGRIHPKKGVDQLIAAWASVEKDHPNWRLRIVGPSENGYAEALQRQAAGLGLARVSFDGPLYGPDKSRAYRDADVFVLPTRNENFGLVVAEALAFETPVICTRGAPWSGLAFERCGWWVAYGATALVPALAEAMTMPPEDLHAMGARGRAWMGRDFVWDAIGMQMRNVYRWMSVGGEIPSTVVASAGKDF